MPFHLKVILVVMSALNVGCLSAIIVCVSLYFNFITLTNKTCGGKKQLFCAFCVKKFYIVKCGINFTNVIYSTSILLSQILRFKSISHQVLLLIYLHRSRQSDPVRHGVPLGAIRIQ